MQEIQQRTNNAGNKSNREQTMQEINPTEKQNIAQ